MGQRKDHSAHMQKVDALGKGQGLGGNFAGWKLEDNGRWLVSAEGHRMAPQQILNAVYIEHLYRVDKTRHENIRQLHVLRELRKAKRL